MTLEDLIRALVGGDTSGMGAPNPPGPLRRERAPMPQAPARYPGQAGALQPQLIPPRSRPFQEALDESSRIRGREREIARRMEPQAAVAPPYPGFLDREAPIVPAERVALSSLQGEYPAGGTVEDWLAGPPRLPPRGALFVDGGERDPEPWRQPAYDTIRDERGREMELRFDPRTGDAIETGNVRQNSARFPIGAPSPRIGGPLGVEGGEVYVPTRVERGPDDYAPTRRTFFPPLPQSTEMGVDDLDAQMAAAMERAQSRDLSPQTTEFLRRRRAEFERNRGALNRERFRSLEDQLRRDLPGRF